MAVRTLAQVSFFDPEFVMPGCLEAGTLPWLLARYRSRLFPSWLFSGWRGASARGRRAWPAPVLMTLILLRWSEGGMSRLAAVSRAQSDAVWRAAMGLQFGAPTPSEKTLRDFERLLRRRHTDVGLVRYMLLHGHLVRLCREEGLGGEDASWGTDSTPMWCYGAVLDTVRLLGDGARRLVRLWARASRTGADQVAAQWGLGDLWSGKSTKGGLKADWRDTASRCAAIDKLAQRVLDAVAFVHQRLQHAAKDKRKELQALGKRLLIVITQNLEADHDGRLVVATRVAANRLASLSDPQARHGRKTASQAYTGFKVHMLGDAVSGLIASLTVTCGNQHDATVTSRLVNRAKELLGSFRRLWADTAYGGAELRHELLQRHGVQVLAPPPVGGGHPEGRLAKQEFAIDFEAQTATCPNGVTTSLRDEGWSAEHARPAWRFHWRKEDCQLCPLRQQCLGSGRGHKKLLLHAYEPELRKAREDWSDPKVREEYKRRSQHERLINSLTRHGARQARGWGLSSANLQAHSVAMANNLKLLAVALARKEETTTLAA